MDCRPGLPIYCPLIDVKRCSPTRCSRRANPGRYAWAKRTPADGDVIAYSRLMHHDLISPGVGATLVAMTTVSVSDLKANLSRYLREVRHGGEVQVLNRGTPIARLVPSAAEADEGDRERLIRAGLLRPGKGGAAAILDESPLVLPTSISEALIRDRTDRL